MYLLFNISSNSFYILQSTVNLNIYKNHLKALFNNNIRELHDFLPVTTGSLHVTYAIAVHRPVLIGLPMLGKLQARIFCSLPLQFISDSMTGPVPFLAVVFSGGLKSTISPNLSCLQIMLAS